MAKKKGDRPELLTKEEMRNLIMVVSGNLYYNTLYNLLLRSGRRIGEIYGTYRNKELTGGIRVKDINFEEKTINTVILKTKKRRLQIECPFCKIKTLYKNKFCPGCGKMLPPVNSENLFYKQTDERSFPISDDMIISLDIYIKKTKLGMNDYLFREHSLVGIKKIIKKHVKIAKINKNFSLHGFRTYFITNCKLAGMSNEDIAKWTGHTNPATINIYDRRVPKDVEDKIKKIQLT